MKYVLSFLSHVCSLLIVLTISPAYAADGSDKDEVVITASRIAQTANELLAPVTVITRADIESRRPLDVLELLRNYAGIDVARSGGPGRLTSLFMRGTNSDHVLVLIDGVRVASASSGSFAWSNLDPAQIERIEIVRGPRATLYGSDAIGGVIQIFTRKPQGINVRMETGSDKTHKGEFGIGGGDAVHFNLQTSYGESQGFSTTNPGAGVFTFNPDKDGYKNHSVSTGLSSKLGAYTEVEAGVVRSYQDIEFDPGNSRSKNLNRAAHLRVRTFNNYWTQTLTLSNALDDSDTFSNSNSSIASRRNMLDWQNDIQFTKRQSLTAGASYYNDDVASINHTTPAQGYNADINNKAAFLNWLGGAGGHYFEAGIRRDSHSRFANHNTGQLAWGWQINSTWRTQISSGTGFKAPSLNQLYHPGYGGGFFAGNPNLLPETSLSHDVGLHITPTQNYQTKIHVYATRVDDLIAFQGINSQAINISQARMRGVEVQQTLHTDQWRISLDATLQKAINDNTNQNLLRRPRKKFGLRADRFFMQHTSLGAEVIGSSSHVDFDGSSNIIDEPGYWLLNLHANIFLSRTLTLEARVENISDESYAVVTGYNMPDRSVFLGLRYNPGDRAP